MDRRSRPATLLALLAAAAVLGGAAWLLLREPPSPAGAPPTADGPGGRAPLEGGPAAPGTTGEAGGPGVPAGSGLVTGLLVLPRATGTPPVEARLTVLREGLPVAEARSGPGPFSLEYDREAEDAAPFRLRAAAPGRSPVEVPLPAPRTDAGTLRLFAGIVYTGVAVDDHGVPQEGVTLHLLVDRVEAAASEPTGADGGFRIPVPPGTRLQGFFAGEGSPGGGRPALEPRAQGRLFVPTPATAEGLAGVHRVVLEERPVGIRLRFLDGPSAAPLAGASVSLWPGAGVFSFGPPTPADAGRTGPDGVWAPRWPLSLEWAALRVAAPGGAVSWTLLERSYAEGSEPREMVIPGEPVEVRASCHLAGTGTPVAGAFVVLQTNAGFPLWGTSGPRGDLRWRLFESESFDPVPLAATGWTASWRGEGGGLRLDQGGNAAGKDLRVEAASGEAVEIPLGASPAPGLWLAVRGEGAGAVALPTFLLGNEAGKDPARDGYPLSFSGFRGPAGTDGRGTLWWAYDYMAGFSPLEGRPPATAVVLELSTADGPAAVVETTLGAVAAARESGAALVFDLAPAEAMTRTVRVLGPDGEPRPGALVAVVRGGAEGIWQRETERLAADGAGEVLLRTLDPAGGSLVLAWDPADGSCGTVEGLGEEAPAERWVVRLEEPREFRLRVRAAAGGGAPWGYASLVPLSGMLPYRLARLDGEGTASLERIPLRGYRVWVSAVDGAGVRHSYDAPAAEAAGTEVVLGEASPTPASGR